MTKIKKFSDILPVLEKLAWVLFCVVIADTAIFGAGRLLEFGPLTFRMITLVLLFICCIPLFIKQFGTLIKNKYLLTMIFFAFWLVVTTVIGILNNNRLYLILTDLKGFAYFLFLPCALAVLTCKERVKNVLKVAMYSAGVQAIMHIIYICIYLAGPSWLDKLSRFFYSRSFLYISFKISSGNVRINFLSAIFLLFGCAFSVYFRIKEDTKVSKIIYPIITAVCLFSINLSYTRSAYLAVGITAIIFLVFLFITLEKANIKKLLVHIATTVLVFACIIGAFQIKTGENYFLYGISRALVGTSIGEFVEDLNNKISNNQSAGDPDDTDNADEDEDDEFLFGGEMDSLLTTTITSDALRGKTVEELWGKIKDSPIIGSGLGSEIPSRPDGLNEYFFLDLFSKTGIIGLVSYLLPILFMLVEFVKNRKRKIGSIPFISFSIIVGFICYSFFTPCMNSSVGIIGYSLIIAIFNTYYSPNKNTIKTEE